MCIYLQSFLKFWILFKKNTRNNIANISYVYKEQQQNNEQQQHNELAPLKWNLKIDTLLCILYTQNLDVSGFQEPHHIHLNFVCYEHDYVQVCPDRYLQGLAVTLVSLLHWLQVRTFDIGHHSRRLAELGVQHSGCTRYSRVPEFVWSKTKGKQ